MSIEVTSVRRVYPFKRGFQVLAVNANNRIIRCVVEDILYDFNEEDGTQQDRVALRYRGRCGTWYMMCIPAHRVGIES